MPRPIDNNRLTVLYCNNATPRRRINAFGERICGKAGFGLRVVFLEEQCGQRR